MVEFKSRVLIAPLFAGLALFAAHPVRAQVQAHIQELLPSESDGAAPTEPEDENRADIRFGRDVAIRNGLAFIGMPAAMTAGRVGVFTQGASGSWARTAAITASDMTSGDEFGGAVSYRDNTLVVGSNRAVYVYKHVNGAWRELQKIVPPATDGVARFATDLKHEAGILAIGAEGNATTRDSLYVYGQDATGRFIRRARLTAPTAQARSGFGRSISMTSSMIVVGAQGAAYILGRNSSGNWVRRQILTTADPNAVDFGAAVAVDRGMILVGAPATPFLSPEHEPVGTGEVYGFLPTATQYVETFRLRTSVPETEESPFAFGSTIAMFGERIAVGYRDFGFDLEELRGFVAVFSREGSTVGFLGSTLDEGGGFNLPRSIAIANNILLIGSPTDGICLFFGFGCFGEANLYNLNRFEP